MFLEAGFMGGGIAFTITMIYRKLPRRVQKFFLDHILFTDVALAILTLGTFGVTVHGIMAAVFLDIFMTCLIHIANHPDDFLYLYDARDAIVEAGRKFTAFMNEQGRKYRENKAQEQLDALAA